MNRKVSPFNTAAKKTNISLAKTVTPSTDLTVPSNPSLAKDLTLSSLLNQISQPVVEKVPPQVDLFEVKESVEENVVETVEETVVETVVENVVENVQTVETVEQTVVEENVETVEENVVGTVEVESAEVVAASSDLVENPFDDLNFVPEEGEDGLIGPKMVQFGEFKKEGDKVYVEWGAKKEHFLMAGTLDGKFAYKMMDKVPGTEDEFVFASIAYCGYFDGKQFGSPLYLDKFALPLGEQEYCFKILK